MFLVEVRMPTTIIVGVIVCIWNVHFSMHLFNEIIGPFVFLSCYFIPIQARWRTCWCCRLEYLCILINLSLTSATSIAACYIIRLNLTRLLRKLFHTKLIINLTWTVTNAQSSILIQKRALFGSCSRCMIRLTQCSTA